MTVSLLRPPLLVVAALMTLAAVPGREAIGVYKGWGAFRDAAPRRCFAIARPVAAGARTGGRATGFASIATWPGRGLDSSLHVRLSRPRDRSAAVTLSVGERRWTLAANTLDAWATDGPSDRAIVQALRSGRSMSVEAVGEGGRPYADTYALTGAATAIDAAALACVAR